MKKKIFSLLLVFCLAVPALLLGGCEKSLNYNQYAEFSAQALKNSYNHILTDKEDLSTQSDFTLTNTTVNKEYDENGVLVEKTTITETHQRKGQGANTVYVITTVNKISTYNEETEKFDEETTTTKDIYTKIVNGELTTYHKLREYTNNEGEVNKSKVAVYTESLYIAAVYNLSDEVFDDLSDLNPSGEMVLITALGEFEAKGDKNHGVMEFTYSSTNYDNYDNVIEKEEIKGEFEYKDAKLYKGTQESKSYYNDVLAAAYEKTMVVEYSCQVSAPTSLDAYN